MNSPILHPSKRNEEMIMWFSSLFSKKYEVIGWVNLYVTDTGVLRQSMTPKKTRLDAVKVKTNNPKSEYVETIAIYRLAKTKRS
jgi:hypothetical protein